MKHQKLVYQNKFTSLMSNYGLDGETGQYKDPLSFKDYLRHLLEREFWGDQIVLYAISCMWGLKISVMNSRTLQEYHICHDVPFTDTDVCEVYNAKCHYSVAGMFSHKVSHIADFTVSSLIGMLVTLIVQIVTAKIDACFYRLGDQSHCYFSESR